MAKIACAIPDFETQCLLVKLTYGVNVGELILVTILPKRARDNG